MSCESFAAFMRPYVQERIKTEEEFMRLLDVLEAAAEMPQLTESSDHFLIIGRAP